MGEGDNMEAAGPARSLAKEVEDILPAVRVCVDERLAPETRRVQEFTILSATLGLAIAAGFVGQGKLSSGGVEFKASAAVLLLVASVSSVFFLVRFLFLVRRDEAANRLKIFAASVSLDDAMQVAHRISQSIDARDRENERAFKALEGSTALGQPSAEQERIRHEWEKLQLEIASHQVRLNTLSALFGTCQRWVNRVDHYVIYFEIALPCLLVAALTCVLAFKASDPAFQADLVKVVSTPDP